MMAQVLNNNKNKKKIENIETQKQDIMNQVKDHLNNLAFEIDQPNTQETYVCTQELTDDDLCKLVNIMDIDERIYDINKETSCLIVGSIFSYNQEKPREFTMGKVTYCRDCDNLIEGCLITVDDTMKCYSKIQTDDIYRSSTIGKIIKIYDTLTYFDLEGNKKSQGEYLISKEKKLNFNTDPSVIRRKSLTQMPLSRSLLTPTSTRAKVIPTPIPTPKTPISRLTRKPSSGNLLSSNVLSPRTIIKYKLIKFM